MKTKRFKINRGDKIERYPGELVEIGRRYCIGQFMGLDEYLSLRLHNDFDRFCYKGKVIKVEHIANDTHYLGNVYEVIGIK